MMDFVELIAKTNYSFLEGASHPEEMVQRATELGYAGIGVTDRNGVYGMARAHVAAKQHKIPLLTGAWVNIDDKEGIHLLARNRNGYGNLCELLCEVHKDRENRFTDSLHP